ncbi:ABC transporter ATP-binding protein [Weissella cibaria]|uniref:ABC transporter ATP-binding protein n=2 Tax=Weissella cibaria TaxID=137591 RepID=UPI00189F92FD|nr:ABC transporter ATP-binding protein [Weissella cibaria]MCT0021147.1 ABC transporter ATP-binding protein [Weissella cibaria]MCT0954017.1 ABC transporter ATP-binding protein [Weissella cibaria]
MADNRLVKVRASFLTKQYEMAPTKSDKMKSLFLKTNFPKFWAVRGVSFEAYEGETIAIVGNNGSGKSTLMKMVAGIVPATSGNIEINGDTSLIAINAGLKGNMSGRENIRLKALMLGLTNEEIDQKMDDIIAFSELGDFIDQQVKSYSSGMKSKLGFSISVHTNPDILIVDEALSVGDATFNKKSLAKIKEFQEQGKTIFFVSHSLGQVRQMADRVLWMHYGEVRMFGPTTEVMDAYDKFISEYKALSGKEQAKYRKSYRDAQASFTLDDLYQRSLKEERRRLNVDVIPADIDKDIYQVTHKRHLAESWSVFDKIFLVIVLLVTLFVGDKLILNMGMRNIIEHPSHLITNWRPSQIHELNVRHMMMDNANSSEKKLEK